jgi:hypothetical protein
MGLSLIDMQAMVREALFRPFSASARAVGKRQQHPEILKPPDDSHVA